MTQFDPICHRLAADSKVITLLQKAVYTVKVLLKMGETVARNMLNKLNPLTPNDHYSGRTAPLTCKRVILYIYSTNIGTECFKHGVYSLSFLLFKIQFVS